MSNRSGQSPRASSRFAICEKGGNSIDIFEISKGFYRERIGWKLTRTTLILGKL